MFCIYLQLPFENSMQFITFVKSKPISVLHVLGGGGGGLNSKTSIPFELPLASSSEINNYLGSIV